MHKDIHFMSGTPRAGNTVLTKILNQNSEILCTDYSDLFNVIIENINGLNNTKLDKSNYMFDLRKNFVENIPIYFYKNIDKKVIIDSSRAWTTEPGFDISKYINPDRKIIFTTRNLVEVVGSFLVMCKTNPNNYIDLDIKNNNFTTNKKNSVDEIRCEWILRPEGDITNVVESLDLIEKNKKDFIIINYDNFIKNYEKQFEKIYSLLKIKNFKHNYNNINTINSYSDEQWLGIKNMHSIRKEIYKKNIDYYSIVPSSILNKYDKILNDPRIEEFSD